MLDRSQRQDSGGCHKACDRYQVSKCRDSQKLYGEVYEKVEKIVEDETNEQVVVVGQKITTKTHNDNHQFLPLSSECIATSISYSKRIPVVSSCDHTFICNAYTTQAIRHRSMQHMLPWLSENPPNLVSAPVCFAVYHVVSGIPAATRVLAGGVCARGRMEERSRLPH